MNDDMNMNDQVMGDDENAEKAEGGMHENGMHVVELGEDGEDGETPVHTDSEGKPSHEGGEDSDMDKEDEEDDFDGDDEDGDDDDDEDDDDEEEEDEDAE